jgi:hypothetical protein
MGLNERKTPRQRVLIYCRNKLRQWRCHRNNAARRGRGAVSLLLANAGRKNDGEQADNVAIQAAAIGSCRFDAAKALSLTAISRHLASSLD